MTKKWVAIAAVVVLSGTSALAGGWGDSFGALDSDGNGRISRTEYEANVAKLKIEPVPTFTAIDVDVNNSVDEDEWATAEKMVKAFPVSCKTSSESWCPKGY